MAGASALSLATLAVVVAATVPVSDGDMRAATDRLLAEVGAVRHVAPRGTFERRVATRAEMRAWREAELAASAADPELAARARLWERLGLPVGSDARSVAEGFDAAPMAAYDALDRRLTVPDWIPLPEQRTALAHALAHALTDQRSGLRDLLQIDLEGRHHLDGDAERARLALVEGDAALAALELDDPAGALTASHALSALVASIATAPAAAPARAAIPAWWRANASFAHADGLAFVARVRARNPWSVVDALWADPPRSSEQIFHPEKYDAREWPVPLAPPKLRALGGAWREAASDVLGELGVRTWLSAAVPEAISARAAAGWGGDRAVLFERAAVDAGAAASSFVVWWTTWDDVTDAEDFATQVPVALRVLAGAGAVATDEDGPVVARRGDAVFAVARRGVAVGLLIGAPAAVLPAFDQGLAALKVSRPPRSRGPAAGPHRARGAAPTP
jgi:hypothetical protein